MIVRRLLSARALRVAAVVSALTAVTAGVAPVSPAPSAQAVGQCSPALAGTVTRTAPGSGKTVALTFDDSRPEYMGKVLAVLRKYNVRATFFNVGRYDAQMPGALRVAASDGHLIEPHTWEHAYPTKANGYWSVPYLANQIRTTAAQQRAVTGKPTCFFRPPGGHMDNVRAATRLTNMRTVLWSVDTQDWSQPPYLSTKAQDAIVRKGTDLRYADRSHPIVLLHAGKASNEPEGRVTSFRGNTVAALPRIIAWYEARGYRFVAMDGTSGIRR